MGTKGNREKEWNNLIEKAKKENIQDKPNIKKIVVEEPQVDVWNDDIANLNDDDDFLPETEEQQPLTEEEKQEVRKKLLIVLGIIVLFILGFLINLVVKPFDKKEEPKKETEKKFEAEPEQKEEDNITKKLKDFSEKDKIEGTNKELQKLYNEILIRGEENGEIDTFKLFTGNVEVNKLPDKYKLFLVLKTNEFIKKIDNPNICNEKISKSDIDKILTDRFNTKVTKYENFNAVSYSGGKKYKYVKLNYKNNEYQLSCFDKEDNITKIAHQRLEYAYRNGDKLQVYIKVAFANKKGIYKDPAFKELITSNFNTTDYMDQTNIYIYEYQITDNSYNLTKIYKNK